MENNCCLGVIMYTGVIVCVARRSRILASDYASNAIDESETVAMVLGFNSQALRLDCLAVHT